MSWKRENKGKIPSFEEILEDSIYEKWFNASDLEINCSKISVDIAKEDTFEGFEKRKELSTEFVPRVDQNIQISDNCLKDNMFLESFPPAKGCKFKFLEENRGFNDNFDKKNSIEWSYSSRIEGKGTKFKYSEVRIISKPRRTRLAVPNRTPKAENRPFHMCRNLGLSAGQRRDAEDVVRLWRGRSDTESEVFNCSATFFNAGAKVSMSGKVVVKDGFFGWIGFDNPLPLDMELVQPLNIFGQSSKYIMGSFEGVVKLLVIDLSGI
uniref:Uncharacterized protein n=1 Tax=Bursaphelenchus xylophilus TaxID=6326 RepID=A0A1I7S2Q5_BURXY